MRKTAILAMVAAFLIVIAVSRASGEPAFVSESSALQNWLPVVTAAMVLGIAITAVYYMAGVVLNNNRIKAAAIGELGQAIGMAVIMIAVVAAIGFFGAGEFSLVSVLSPSNMITLCGQLAGSNVAVLNSAGVAPSSACAAPTASDGLGEEILNPDMCYPGGKNNPSCTSPCVLTTASCLMGVGAQYACVPPGYTPTTTNAICSQIAQVASGGADATQSLDYGLLSDYVIMANVTNQAANNLNSLYVFETWLGFMSHFTVISAICTPACYIPEATMVNVTFQPLSGYDKSLSGATPIIEGEAGLSFYILYVQLMLVLFLLFAWPYLIAAGLILRSTFFTRRVGGLLIAIGIVAVLIYPLMGVLEYTASSGGAKLTPIGNSIAINSLSNMQLFEKVTNTVTGATNTVVYGSNGIDFFVLPNAGDVIDYYGCMPSAGLLGVNVFSRNVAAGEAAFSGFYLIPGIGLGTALISAAGSLAGSLPIVPPLSLGLASNCTPDNALSTMFALITLYGVTFVTSIVLPLLNALIALAATMSLSKLFGGDTDIVGLGRII